MVLRCDILSVTAAFTATNETKKIDFSAVDLNISPFCHVITGDKLTPTFELSINKSHRIFTNCQNNTI